ncbi:MAG: Thiol-disulfide isomerase or thioredoxin [Mucilaginibacter sp.]|nr:Thiol-disulfide isomerase or thioredoxin [Mucilaginibacter sp.]
MAAAFTAYSQAKPNTKALIIHGQLNNYPEKKLVIRLEKGYERYTYDTVSVDQDGRFYLKTYHALGPQMTSIGYNKTSIQDIFVAPGYDLNITADCKDLSTQLVTLKISGAGSESNAYAIQALRIMVADNKPVAWYELSDADLLTFIRHERKAKDSLVQLFFSKPPEHDPYFLYFKKMAGLDNQFMSSYYILIHAEENILTKKFDRNQAIAYVNGNSDQRLLQQNKGEYIQSRNYQFDHNQAIAYVNRSSDQSLLQQNKDEYIRSRGYRLVLNTNLAYQVQLDYLSDSSLRKQPYYALQKAERIYSGKARVFAVYQLITSTNLSPDILHAGSFTELLQHEKSCDRILHGYRDRRNKVLV